MAHSINQQFDSVVALCKLNLYRRNNELLWRLAMRISNTKVMQWVDSDNAYKGVVIVDEETGDEVVLSPDELKEVVDDSAYFLSHMS
jgi:hypothetical protein